MKKFFALVVFLTTISMTAQAQFDFGVKGGLNLSKLSLDKKVVSSDNQVGWFIGPTVKFTVPLVGIGVDAAALFDQRSGELEYRIDNTETSTKLKQQSIQIPINVRWGFGVCDVANIFIFLGPQFGFNVGDKSTDFMNGGVEWTYKSSNISGNAGLGVTLFNHLQVSFNYNLAFGKSGEFKVKDENGAKFGYNGVKSDAKMNTWQIALAYYF